MTSTFFADTNSKIRKLKKDKTYPVQNRSGLQLIKRGNSKYFVGNMRFPFTRNGKNIPVQIGVFDKEISVEDAIDKWHEIKIWSKANNKNPKLFGVEEEEKASDKTLHFVAEEWFNDVYRHKVKEKVYKDRRNKFNQMLRYIGEDKLITDLQRDKKGRTYCKEMLKSLFPESPVQLTRCRQLLGWIFAYAEEEEFIGKDQNPLYKKFKWETGSKRVVSTKTFAQTITSKS